MRVEEFVNHFDYDYAAPDREAFEVYVDGAHSPFGTEGVRLLRIGIKGKEVRPENRKPANLTFVVDVSGSMGREDRLGLVRKSLRLLLDELDERDRVGIVVYGSTGRVILEPTSITDKDRIVRANRTAPSERLDQRRGRAAARVRDGATAVPEGVISTA